MGRTYEISAPRLVFLYYHFIKLCQCLDREASKNCQSGIFYCNKMYVWYLSFNSGRYYIRKLREFFLTYQYVIKRKGTNLGFFGKLRFGGKNKLNDAIILL